MKILVTGVNGQLGFDVTQELLRRNITRPNTKTNTRGNTNTEPSVASRQLSVEKYEIVATDVVIPDFDFLSSAPVSESASQLSLLTLDITDKAAVHRLICNGLCSNVADSQLIANSQQPIAKFDCVVHCAAWTAVDAAEENEEKCRAVNVEGTRNIAEACAEVGAKMIYISTDYVFSGEGTEPWEADCRDFAPQNVYGRSKLDGEIAVAENLDKFFIVRTAWVFGNHGNNFVKTMLKVGATHDEVRVVNDQIGTPTYTPDLAKLLCDMAESDKYGYYHATNEGGFISWYDFTCEIYRQAGYNTKVTPVTTAEYGLSRAKRPANSRLDKSKLIKAGFKPLRSWQEALESYLKNFNE